MQSPPNPQINNWFSGLEVNMAIAAVALVAGAVYVAVRMIKRFVSIDRLVKNIRIF
ncbi:MAG: hypothetical protein M1383_06015 [Patescibacteria group bacterium]|nr:hypothetical protein [Patescibacteria group bacterium]